MVVPLPSCPEELYPQVYNVPSFLAATVWYCPTAIATTPFRPLTVTGVELVVMLPLPN